MALLLQHGADENARDKNWQTPAHVAAANNAVRCMELIIPVMANVNITDRMGRTSLHLAAYFGHLEVRYDVRTCLPQLFEMPLLTSQEHVAFAHRSLRLQSPRENPPEASRKSAPD